MPPIEHVADAIRNKLLGFGIDDLDDNELEPIAKAAIAAMRDYARYDYGTSLEGCVIVVEYLQAALNEG